MKKIIRLTESDLIKLVKRVISEQDLFGVNDYMSKSGSGVLSNEFQKGEEIYNKIKKMSFYVKPTYTYLSPEGDFITLNWNRPSEPGNNIIAVTYRKGDNTFDINLVDDKSKIEKCKKIKQSIDYLNGLGGVGNFRDTNKVCGGTVDFNVENIDKLPTLVNKLHKEII